MNEELKERIHEISTNYPSSISKNRYDKEDIEFFTKGLLDIFPVDRDPNQLELHNIQKRKRQLDLMIDAYIIFYTVRNNLKNA